MLTLLVAAVLQPAYPQAMPQDEAARQAIAAERAFAARAQSEGQWTAFRATAAADAIMVAPGPVNAQDFLGRFTRDPAVSVMWWPARVWTSCDGTLAVTSGPWVRNGGTQVGSFTTVWRREAGGGWKWIYDNGRDLPAAIAAPDVPVSEEVYCGGQPARIDLSDSDPPPMVQFEDRAPGDGADAVAELRFGARVAGSQSLDRSLRWELVRVNERGENAYAFRLYARTRNHQRLALIDLHGLEPPRP